MRRSLRKAGNYVGIRLGNEKVGIDRYAGSVVYLRPVTNYREIRKLNEDELRIRDKYSSYIPGINVHGDFPEESIADLTKYYHEGGIRLIGELVPYLMKTVGIQFTGNDPDPERGWKARNDCES